MGMDWRGNGLEMDQEWKRMGMEMGMGMGMQMGMEMGMGMGIWQVYYYNKKNFQ